MLGVAISVPSQNAPLDPSAPVTAWAQASPVDLQWDVIGRRQSTEATTVRIATDGKSLLVRFDAQQREPIVAVQRTNDVGQGNDDAVWVDLWPTGSTGFYYQFQATPAGTRYESSSENAGYQPTWESHGFTRAGSYTVTMRIPFNVLRGAHIGRWNAQFVRYIHATGEEQVWSYDATQISPDDVARAGALQLTALSGNAAKPKPRVALYGLGLDTSQGPSARGGADVSVPIAPTASIYATIHPDFSNVELDQQTISPSVYQRFFSEVRPFFTQAASTYNVISYYASVASIQALYTPAIPTPVDGIAIEGKEGPLSIASFDAIGDQRNDAATALVYTSPSTNWRGSVEHVTVTTPSLVDDVTEASARYSDLQHATAYVTYGTDSGTNVLAGNDAQWYDAGASWTSKTFAAYFGDRKVGDYYNPVDGFVFHPGIAGYGLYSVKIFDFGPNSKFASIGTALTLQRFQGRTGGSNESDNQLLIDLLTKRGFDLQVYTGSDYFKFANLLTPVSQSAGFSLTYDGATQTDNPSNFPSHGNAATPTTISLNTGRYGVGTLNTWMRSSTVHAGNRGYATLTVNDTQQTIPRGTSNIQWFESLAYTNQLNADSSLSIGLRRVDGAPPTPNGGGDCVGSCDNISAAYRYRMHHSELYLSYGDPNTLTTAPQALIKFILYVGADKGS